MFVAMILESIAQKEEIPMAESQPKSKWGEVSAARANNKGTIAVNAGLIKAIHILGPTSSEYVLFFDGFRTVRVPLNNVNQVSLTLVDEPHPQLDECPIAQIDFWKYPGSRDPQYDRWDITIYFKDKAQLERYVQLAILPSPADLNPDQLEALKKATTSDPSGAVLAGGLIGLGLGFFIS